MWSIMTQYHTWCDIEKYRMHVPHYHVNFCFQKSFTWIGNSLVITVTKLIACYHAIVSKNSRWNQVILIGCETSPNSYSGYIFFSVFFNYSPGKFVTFLIFWLCIPSFFLLLPSTMLFLFIMLHKKHPTYIFIDKYWFVENLTKPVIQTFTSPWLFYSIPQNPLEHLSSQIRFSFIDFQQSIDSWYNKQGPQTNHLISHPDKSLPDISTLSSVL